MNLYFNTGLTAGYRSHSQIARVLTESWVADNMYCPRCGSRHILHFKNNRPVADFYCPCCGCQYELKSKHGPLGKKISDGAYHTMLERITSNTNPDFFFMNYSQSESMVRDLIFVPKHFFVPDIIEKRRPLSSDAQRAGWVGCNILIDRIPPQGRISVISEGIPSDSASVINKVSSSLGLSVENMESRGWIMDILNCINLIKGETFTLGDVYFFEKDLAFKHPMNNNIRPKIRQQLQLLRDKGFVEFLGRGNYRKVL